MTDDNTNKTTEMPDAEETEVDAARTQQKQESAQDGPTFTKSPDPLSGARNTADNLMASMEGKTVSMKVYVGSILGVIVLMMLGRCGG